MSRAEEEEEGTQDAEMEYEILGMFSTVIVGIRYYTGRVGVNELVKFTREPNNPYDANAIRVENIYNEMVGHLKRELAFQIAPLLDNGSLRIEGIMPGGGRSAYTMPINVYCFGSSSSINTIGSSISDTLRFALLAAGCRLQPVTLEQAITSMQGGSSTQQYGSHGSSSSSGRTAAANMYLAPAQLENSLNRLFEDLYSSVGPKPRMNPDLEVLSQLFPHQQEALAWMINRENSGALPPFWETTGGPASSILYKNTLTNFETAQRPDPLLGGILADDMGLGKTLMIISLIATNRPGVALPEVLDGSANQGDGAAAAAGDGGAAAAAAAERPSKRRKKGAAAASSSSAAGGGRRAAAAKTAAAKTAAAKTAAAKTAAAEPPAVPPAADGPRGTLIVCPLSVLSNWQIQFEDHTAGNLQVVVYHGPERNRSRAWLSRQDVVITTYQTLTQDMGLRGGQGLLGVPWLRLVLDEAHTIRNSETQQAKACRAVKASRRWAVTGTPLQNRLSDVFGLMVFLGLKPLCDKPFWRATVERPLKVRDPKGLMTLKILMGSLALRRTKDSPGADGRPLVALPTKTVQMVHVKLSKEDAEHYKLLERESKSLVAHHLSEGTLVQNFTNILAIIMRLRQVCNSSRLCPEALEALRTAAAAAAAKQGARGAPPPPELLAKLLAALAGEEGSEECAICLSPLELPCITSCGHVFCRRCIEAVIVRDKPSCPLCRTHITSSNLIDPPPPEESTPAADDAAAAAAAVGDPQDHSKSTAAAVAASSKIQALLMKLRETEAETAQAAASAAATGEAPPAPLKAVVFSQFRGMLDLLAFALDAEGIPFVRIDGSSSAKARRDAMLAFAGSEEGAPRVFLASLKAVGLGTNLTAASHVHMMDPWWNPAVEDQAMDRVHRLGQTRPVSVWRYVAQGTIEERMLEMQAIKAQLAKAAWVGGRQVEGAEAGSSRGGSSSSSSRDEAVGIRVDDIRRLMDLME